MCGLPEGEAERVTAGIAPWLFVMLTPSGVNVSVPSTSGSGWQVVMK